MAEELNAWDWIAKINEKITFLRLNVLEHRDITEEDYDMLKVWYCQWWFGTHPFYTENVIQDDFSCQNVSTTSNGTIVEHIPNETKKIKK